MSSHSISKFLCVVATELRNNVSCCETNKCTTRSTKWVSCCCKTKQLGKLTKNVLTLLLKSKRCEPPHFQIHAGPSTSSTEPSSKGTGHPHATASLSFQTHTFLARFIDSVWMAKDGNTSQAAENRALYLPCSDFRMHHDHDFGSGRPRLLARTTIYIVFCQSYKVMQQALV